MTKSEFGEKLIKAAGEKTIEGDESIFWGGRGLIYFYNKDRHMTLYIMDYQIAFIPACTDIPFSIIKGIEKALLELAAGKIDC